MKLAVFVVAFVISNSAAAQHAHGGMQSPPRDSSSNIERRILKEQPLFFDAEVRAIDKESGRITLKHDSLPIFDVPAATAVYAIKDTAVLDQIRPGDKVRFTAVLQGRLLVVTKIAVTN